MRQLSNDQLRQVTGGCLPNCVPVDRRPISPVGGNYDPTHLGTSAPGDRTGPLPQPFWPIDRAQ